MGSSEGSLAAQEEAAKKLETGVPLSLHDQLLLAKSKARGSQELKSLVRSPGVVKDINKQKKKKALKPEAIAQSLKEMRNGGMLLEGLSAPLRGAGLHAGPRNGVRLEEKEEA